MVTTLVASVMRSYISHPHIHWLPGRLHWLFTVNPSIMHSFVENCVILVMFLLHVDSYEFFICIHWGCFHWHWGNRTRKWQSAISMWKTGPDNNKKLQYNRLPTSRQPLEHRKLIVYNTKYVQNLAPIWHYNHNGVSVLVADGLVPVWCQGVCNHHEKVGRWPLVRNVLG